ncbi:MAG: hypothetical protein JRI34_12920 [Deltaproteobacteria bacterium]|nr:hypothetical protein [Deltaproteobacteria bacterium]
MTERLKFEGRLGELTREAQKLRLRLESTRDGLRDALDPTVEVDGLDSERVFDLALQFRDLAVSLEKVKQGISKTKKALGQ